MIGKAISQHLVVDKAGQAHDCIPDPGSVEDEDPFVGSCAEALKRAATNSHRSHGMRRGCSILAATFFAMAGAIPDLGRGESVPPRVLHQAADGSSEVGVASWYGHPYHGRQAANGERYDMNRLTAAHRFLPFGTRVRVHNLRNASMVEVRITDRGPFVEGRLIDLSRAAAQVLGFQRAGLERVRLEVVPGAAAAASLQ
jgi:rare lipoprotein A (peptidoglycan hydrolase)